MMADSHGIERWEGEREGRIKGREEESEREKKWEKQRGRKGERDRKNVIYTQGIQLVIIYFVSMVFPL